MTAIDRNKTSMIETIDRNKTSMIMTFSLTVNSNNHCQTITKLTFYISTEGFQAENFTFHKPQSLRVISHLDVKETNVVIGGKKMNKP